MRIPAFLALILAAGCMPDLPTGGGGGHGTPDAAPVVQPDAKPIPIDAADPLTFVKQWSGCMTLANFHTARMAATWGTMAAQDGQACANCHNLGQQGFMASSNEAVFFKMITEHSSYMLKYFAVDTSLPQPVTVNKQAFMSAIGYAGHPQFDTTTNAGMSALKSFYDLTVTSETPGPCGPSVLVD